MNGFPEKGVRMKIAAILALAAFLLAGCAVQHSLNSAPATEITTAQTGPTINSAVPDESLSVETTESTASLKLASDEELIAAVIESKALRAWGVMSGPIPESEEGIKVLTDNCPEFKELLSRDSGLQSLREYGPQIAEEYGKHDDSYYRLNAMMMQNLLAYLFP